MARFFSRSTRQLYSSRYIMQPQHVIPVRFYAKESASKAYNETMKGIFLGVKDKFETTIGVLQSKMKDYADFITPVEGIGFFKSMRIKSVMFQIIDKNLDPSKPDFEMKLMNEVKKIGKIFSKIPGQEMEMTEMKLMYKICRYAFITKWRIGRIQDARTRLLILMDIFVEDWARPEVEAMLMAAVDKVEEKIKKPLMVNNKKGYDLLRDECVKKFKIAPRLGMGMIKKDAREVVQAIFV